MSEAEKEELAVRKRREEGTPVNDSTFADWWARFQQEQEQAIAEKGASEKTTGDDDDKLTGFQIFSEKAGVFSLEKLEAAAEEMENEEFEVDEELFDDDEDLDDLDFEDDEDDDSEMEPDI